MAEGLLRINHNQTAFHTRDSFVAEVEALIFTAQRGAVLAAADRFRSDQDIYPGNGVKGKRAGSGFFAQTLVFLNISRKKVPVVLYRWAQAAMFGIAKIIGLTEYGGRARTTEGPRPPG
jgi:hypothetical protein